MENDRFSQALRTIGWQGGTIHQVNECLGVSDIYTLSNEDFLKLLDDYVYNVFMSTEPCGICGTGSSGKCLFNCVD